MIYVVVACGLTFGLSLGLILIWLKKKRTVNLAEKLAQDIIDEAEERAQESLELAKSSANDHRENRQDQLEKDLIPIHERIETLRRLTEEKAEDFQDKLNRKKQQFEAKNNKFSTTEHVYKQKLKQFESKKQLQQQRFQQYIEALSTKHAVDMEQLRQAIAERLQHEEKSQVTKYFQLQK